MSKKWIAAGIALAVALPGVAFADHGKAGLWNVSTSMTMAMPQMPPEAMAQMRAMGMKMPNNRTFNSQICMTEADVKSDKPPSTGRNNENCSWINTKMSGSGMSANMVCHGRMEGTGRVEVSYNGSEHYRGSYAFKGSMEGQAADMKSTFSGDWVKADCGAVKTVMH